MGFQMTNLPEADKVLDEYPFAVVLGMMLDQQYGMEHAFRGGWKVLSRFGTLDPAAIAAADPETFKELCSAAAGDPSVPRLDVRPTAGVGRAGRVPVRR